MTPKDLFTALGVPLAQLVACAALIALAAAALLAYVGKRDAKLRDEIEADTNERLQALEKRVEGLERRCTEARAINAEAIAEASRLGEPASRLCSLLVRQAAVLG